MKGHIGKVAHDQCGSMVRLLLTTSILLFQKMHLSVPVSFLIYRSLTWFRINYLIPCYLMIWLQVLLCIVSIVDDTKLITKVGFEAFSKIVV